MAETDETPQTGTPLREVGVECTNCGCTERRPDSHHCAACGQFAADPIYAYSRVTDTWYRVTEYDRVEGEKIVAKEKVEVDREAVPQAWLDATDERPLDADMKDGETA